MLLQLKEDYRDGAEPRPVPCRSSTCRRWRTCLPTVAGFDGKIRQTLGAFASRAGQMGRSVPMMLAALSTYHAGMPQVVIVGEPRAEDTEALKRVLSAHYLPTAIVLTVTAATPRAAGRSASVGCQHEAVDSRAPLHYVCRDFACQSPAISAAELEQQLRSGFSRTARSVRL